MSNEFQFKTEAEFFNAVGDHCLHPTSYGETFYSITIEELYQHFKARLLSEQEEGVTSLLGKYKDHPLWEGFEVALEGQKKEGE